MLLDPCAFSGSPTEPPQVCYVPIELSAFHVTQDMENIWYSLESIGGKFLFENALINSSSSEQLLFLFRKVKGSAMRYTFG